MSRSGSRGRLGALRVPEVTLAEVGERGVAVEVLRTAEALERYEELRAEGRAVGALVHSTC